MASIDNNEGIIKPLVDDSEDDKCIYFRVLDRKNGAATTSWYVIRGDCNTPENVYLKPVFVKKKKTHQNFSAVAAVGSFIYAFGGGDKKQFDDKTHEVYDGTVKSVYYIDTNSPETGWQKARSMRERRSRFSAVHVSERKEVYVFRGRFNDCDAEVYNLETKIWRHRKMDIPIPPLTSHAVVDGGKRLLLMSRSDDQLFSYDVDNNSCSIEREEIIEGEFVNTMVMSNDVLYLAGYNLPSCIMALELNKPGAEPKKISGLEERDKGLPSPTNFYATLLHVVEIAKNKLALVWGRHSGINDFGVHCVKLKISKGVDEAGETTFTAHSITKSIYYVEGFLFDAQVLAIDTSYWNDKDPEEMKLKDDKKPDEMKLRDDKETEEKKSKNHKTKSKNHACKYKKGI